MSGRASCHPAALLLTRRNSAVIQTAYVPVDDD